MYFHAAIFSDIELKMNLYKTYTHSVYVLFPGRCEGASKQKLLNKFYLTITCPKSTINTLNQDVESV